MVEGGGGPAFPVLFFDGEREMNIGDVKIHPTLEYKPFQLMLSQKIGISPNQISIYLVHLPRSNHKSPFPEERRRIPITGKVNFGLICRQRDCCFLVVLKRSRKSRNRRERTANAVEFADFLLENEFSPPRIRSLPVPENLILLRRNQAAPPLYDQFNRSDLNDRLESLRIQRENYQMAMARVNFDSDPNPNPGTGMGMDSIPMVDGWYDVPSTATNKEIKMAYCEECANAKKNGYTASASFHLCVNDPVVKPFTTRLGPINPPNKPFR
ncbi:hypothetical protein ABFS82_10G062100 [Erythranthe guttata]|uniref:DUF7138 domain-containing protein n=1 Tax=Erythranthe guttata TaxID=4155 RepID=A0A022PV67_ERYGU|nr:hypothetical protein MIMGU_mgv1a011855mg [Erythranthe guttata]